MVSSKDSVSPEEGLLIEIVRTYADKQRLAYKTVPMTHGAEPRIGLGFQPSGYLRKVVARLSLKKHSVRAYSCLGAGDAAAFGPSRTVDEGGMCSLTMLPWPLTIAQLWQFLDASVAHAREAEKNGRADRTPTRGLSA